MSGQTLGSSTPGTNIPLKLSSGTVVRIRDVTIAQTTHRKSLTLYIQTPTASSDSEQLLREAREVVDRYDLYAVERHVGAINIAVCRTRGCIEMRELPDRLFTFARQSNGSWERPHRR